MRADPDRSEAYDDLLLVDDDDKVFVNYLPRVFNDFGLDHGPNPIDGLIKHRDQVLNILNSGLSRRIRDKYLWAAKYHNYVVSNLPDAAMVLKEVGLNKKDLLITYSPTRTFEPFKPR